MISDASHILKYAAEIDGWLLLLLLFFFLLLLLSPLLLLLASLSPQLQQFALLQPPVSSVMVLL